MNNQQFTSQPPLPHLLLQISLLPLVFSPWRYPPSSLGPGLIPHFSACSLSSGNPGSLQGSDELSPTAAVLSNAGPHSAVEWKAGMPITAALAGAQGKPCAPRISEPKGFIPLPRAGTLRGELRRHSRILWYESKDTQNIFNKVKLSAQSCSNRHNNTYLSSVHSPTVWDR